jgi:hypothetical protein
MDRYHNIKEKRRTKNEERKNESNDEQLLAFTIITTFLVIRTCP